MKNNQNPYQIGLADKPVIGQGDISSQLRQFETEDKNSKAPPILPYPVDNILPILANALNAMIDARTMVCQADNNPAVVKDKLEMIKDEIDRINIKIIDLSNYLSIIAL